MRQFTDYCSIIFCVTTASTEEDRRYSLAVSSGSLPFPYPLLGDQPGQLVLPGDVDHCQSCNFFSNSSITFLEEYLLQGWTNRGRQCELPMLDCGSTTLPSQSNCVISRFGHESLKGWVYSFKILQADIVACAINEAETCHILGALPTGYGKSLPILVSSCLLV